MTYANTDTIFWDLDNTLYRNTPEIEEEFHRAIASTMIEVFGLPYSMEQATDKARQSFEETGFSGSYFIRDHTFDRPRMRLEFFDRMTTDALAKDDTITQFFDNHMASTNNVIITHSIKIWSAATIEKIGLRPHFPETHILHPEDHDMAHKDKDTRLFDEALSLINGNVANTVMIEDVPTNLIIPKQMGMKTVLIHHGRHQDKNFDHVDHRYDTVTEFLDDFLD